MSGPTPEAYARRSFLYRKLLGPSSVFADLGGVAIAESLAEPAVEAAQAAELALCDLSPLARTGFKGPGTPEWLQAQGVEVPGASNQAVVQADGAMAARLAPNELLILGDLRQQSDLPGRLEQVWAAAENPPASPRGFPVPRQDSHAWLCLSGRHADLTLAKVCGVDLRPARFGVGSIAQTSVARLSAIVIRRDLGSTLAYYLLTDSASAEYFWDCLLDAMAEFGGRPVGVLALRALAER